MNIKYFLLVVAAALLSALSRMPWNMGFLVFVSMLPLLHFFDHGHPRTIHLLIAAALYSAVYVPLLMYWIVLVTPGGLVGIFLLYTWYFFVAFYVINRISTSLPRLRYIGFIVVMISFEYIQNYGELRFPWLNLGYSLADYLSLIQFTAVGGMAGLSFLILLINLLLYKLIDSENLASAGRYLVAVGLILSAWITYGEMCLKTIELKQHDFPVAVMQPAIEQEDKWDTEYLNQILAINEELTEKAAADSMKLMIWPEGAMPTYIRHFPAQMAFVQTLSNRLGMEIFTGFPDYEPAPEEHHDKYYYYNAAALISPFKEISELYYKIVLVPVGERMPWLKTFPFLWALQFGQANWEFGTEIRYYKSNGYRFSPSICYEIAFPDITHKMAAYFDRDKAELHRADFLVNITNDAWFGTSYGPWLHGVHTRFRAIENRIQIYRSANTGISMIVDPMGRILKQTKLFERTNITAPLYTTEHPAPLRRYFFYPIFIVLFALVLFIVAALTPMNEKQELRRRVRVKR